MAAVRLRVKEAISRAQRCLEEGRARDALGLCETARKVAPHHPVLLKLGAIAAFQSGDPQKAIGLLGAAVARYPNDAEAQYNLGVIHQAGGLMEAALANFARAAELAPASAAGHYNKATALHELGRVDEAIHAYRDAVAADSNYTPAYAGLAFVLRAKGQLEEAIAAYEKALQFDPGDSQTQTGYGVTLQHLGRLSEAAAALRYATALDLDYSDACTNLVDVLVEQGNLNAALAECDRYLARHPGDSGVLAAKAIVLGESGALQDVSRLVNLDRFLVPERQTAPAGFADIETFNAALSERILSHPSLVEAPASHATRAGKHTGELIGEASGPMATFQTMVDDAVTRYRARLGDDPTHPFVVNALSQWRLTAWSIVLQGAGGYQASHIHPSAWLSGVYYARVPAIVKDSSAGKAGWIEFGQPSKDFYWTWQPPLQAVRPEPGLLVLFPSYFFHRTIAYDLDETRISIAFDVLPIG